ncbi:hypothetical protein, partial [Ectopseudomonas oleovorans]|uniref:hypothetical protein n=1 Tax=Ectopseudomonas oleovorans TaxID=301 RepID=UPI001A90B243
AQRGITVRMRVEWVSESAWNPQLITGQITLASLLAGVVETLAVTTGKHSIQVQDGYTTPTAWAQEPRALAAEVAGCPGDADLVVQLLALAMPRKLIVQAQVIAALHLQADAGYHSATSQPIPVTAPALLQHAILVQCADLKPAVVFYSVLLAGSAHLAGNLNQLGKMQFSVIG